MVGVSPGKTLNSNYDRVFTSFGPIQKKSNSTTFPMRKYGGFTQSERVKGSRNRQPYGSILHLGFSFVCSNSVTIKMIWLFELGEIAQLFEMD